MKFFVAIKKERTDKFIRLIDFSSLAHAAASYNKTVTRQMNLKESCVVGLLMHEFDNITSDWRVLKQTIC